MSKETYRGSTSDKNEVKSDTYKHKLAYPASRATAALERWKREMLLHLGGKELSQVAEDVGELEDMPEKRATKQGTLASILLDAGGCLRKLPNVREHLLQTQSGPYEKEALKRHGGRLFKVMCEGIESLPIPKEQETLAQWELSRMRTLKLNANAPIEDIRSYLTELDAAIKDADNEMGLEEYRQILDRTVERGDGEYQRSGWHRFWQSYARDVVAMGRELSMLEMRTAFETWW